MDKVDRILEQWNQTRPDLDVGPMGTLGRLRRLADHINQELNLFFRAHGLTAASFDVLATLRRSGPPYALNPSALMAWTMVTSGTMTNRLDRLEADGLIERHSNPLDRRGSVVALTEQGLRRIDAMMADYVAHQRRILDRLPPALRPLMEDGLRGWLAGFEPPESSQPEDITPADVCPTAETGPAALSRPQA